MEAMHYAFGAHDVIVIADMADNASAAALSPAVSAAGRVKTTVTPLLRVEEVDTALKKSVAYRPPGS